MGSGCDHHRRNEGLVGFKESLDRYVKWFFLCGFAPEGSAGLIGCISHLLDDFAKASAPYAGPLGRLFLWTTPSFFTPMQILFWTMQKTLLEKAAGAMEKVQLTTIV